MSEVGSVNEWVAEANRQSSAVDTCIPRFHRRAVEDKKRSGVEGRSCFNNIEYVEMFIPGDKLSRPCKKVTDEERNRWPEAYEKFRKGIEVSEDGTPLEAWAFLNPGRVAELKVLGIVNVEALAAVSDGHLAKLGHGGLALRKRAQEFVMPQKQTETKLRKENQELKDDMEALKAQVERLAGQIQAASSPKINHNDMPLEEVERHISS